MLISSRNRICTVFKVRPYHHSTVESEGIQGTKDLCERGGLYPVTVHGQPSLKAKQSIVGAITNRPQDMDDASGRAINNRPYDEPFYVTSPRLAMTVGREL